MATVRDLGDLLFLCAKHITRKPDKRSMKLAVPWAASGVVRSRAHEGMTKMSRRSPRVTPATIPISCGRIERPVFSRCRDVQDIAPTGDLTDLGRKAGPFGVLLDP
jgi:hypothetical protein